MALRIIGHGLAMEFRAPFQVGRVADHPVPGTLVVAHPGEDDQVKNALIVPGEGPASLAAAPARERKEGFWLYAFGTAGPTIALGEQMESLEEIVSVTQGPAPADWKVATDDFVSAWPEGFRLGSSDQPRCVFELLDDDVLVMVRGPLSESEVPSPPDLVGPGQKVLDMQTDSDVLWMDLAYEHEGQAWNQRHLFAVLAPKTFVVITGQAPEGAGDRMRAACLAIEESLARRGQTTN